MNYFKAEVYRFLKSKMILSSLILIALYTLFGNYVYKTGNLIKSDLYNNFGQEYLLIFLLLSFIMVLYLFGDDLNNKLYYEYNPFKMTLVKGTIWALYLVLIVITTFLFSCFFSVCFSLDIALSVSTFLNTIKVIPIILTYSLFLLMALLICKKGGISMTFVFGIYTMFSYLEISLPNLKESILKYLFVFNLDFNNLYIGLYEALGILFITFIIISLTIRFLLKKMT